MTTAVLRKELQGYIAKMPERNLAALKPLLSVLAEPLYTIEPASPAECKRIEKRVKEYHENPASFVPWKRRVTTEPASQEEAAMIDKRVKEYEKDPSSFVARKKRIAR